MMNSRRLAPSANVIGPGSNVIRQIMESIVYRRWDAMNGNAVGGDAFSVFKKGVFQVLCQVNSFFIK